ncbi:protein HEXIM1 [Scaptodrosophila lebanonensis]|uniref:Protein HEXIM1 n=1 Tax=Drosophila lebanonensis TaxID=7225 RepID=A0A6J2TJH7_DROLE|nr:protein HEXIM1 [Scaptodrosophila lebanonensis]
MAEAVKTEKAATSRQRNSDGCSSAAAHKQLPKRKHRRGKKSKMVPKKSKNQYAPWKMDLLPRPKYGNKNDCFAVGNSGKESNASAVTNARTKLLRSRSLLVPYNTNRFLMEEHMSELPKDDSDDNCFGSQTDDQELFLSKEFSSVYERARVERLETMSKQELIQECLQIEDRYSKDQGRQRLQNLNAQNISKEYGAKIRSLEEKIRELARENQILRSHLIRSPTSTAAAAAAASPPSAAAPTASTARELQARHQTQQPTPMDSSSEDSESDSSSTTSTTTSTSSSSSEGHEMGVAGLNIANGHAERSAQRHSRSRSRSPILANGHANEEERCRLLDTNQLDEEDNSSEDAKNVEEDVTAGK